MAQDIKTTDTLIFPLCLVLPAASSRAGPCVRRRDVSDRKPTRLFCNVKSRDISLPFLLDFYWTFQLIFVCWNHFCFAFLWLKRVIILLRNNSQVVEKWVAHRQRKTRFSNFDFKFTLFINAYLLLENICWWNAVIFCHSILKEPHFGILTFSISAAS